MNINEITIKQLEDVINEIEQKLNEGENNG